MPILVTGPLTPAAPRTLIPVPVERRTLAKRRWQIALPGGPELGFDLQAPLADGSIVYEDDRGLYCLRQKPESVYCIVIADATQAAAIGWSLGNLHFPIQVDGRRIVVAEDDAIRLHLERQHFAFTREERVFRPLQMLDSHHGQAHHH